MSGAWRSLASASEWGSEGRKFESCRPDNGRLDVAKSYVGPSFFPAADFLGRATPVLRSPKKVRPSASGRAPAAIKPQRPDQANSIDITPGAN